MGDALYDGQTADALRGLLDLPRVEVYARVGSTLDVAHALGEEGAPAGTLILAEEQTAGRGRGGRRWASAPGAGVWLTLLERPSDPSSVALLSIRLGLRAARVLDRYSQSPVRLKWPNDLYTDHGKLAGILVETRWREDRIDWVAIGLGVNVRRPEGVPRGASLADGCERVELLTELVPALRAAAAARGALTDRELAAYGERDLARGRRCVAPVAGVVQGIDATGALVVRTTDGEVTCRTGSLVLEEDA